MEIGFDGYATESQEVLEAVKSFVDSVDCLKKKKNSPVFPYTKTGVP